MDWNLNPTQAKHGDKVHVKVKNHDLDKDLQLQL